MNSVPNSEILDPSGNEFVYGVGRAMQSLNAIVSEIARTPIPVLIIGESGTGKDAYARLIHRLSQMSETPLRKINCAAPDPSSFFGHVHETTRGSSRSLPYGTLYLDNLHELGVASQRTLYSHLIDSDRLAGDESQGTRVISSAMPSLENDVAATRFSKELYFLVNGACLRLPPLRERRDDIPTLMEYFLTKHFSVANKGVPSVNRQALDTLMAYHWPGNIRELENLALKIVAFGEVQAALRDLPTPRTTKSSLRRNRPGQPLKILARDASRQAERQLIMQALERTQWNRKRAARELQISYKALLYKIKQIGSLNVDHEG